MVPKPFKRKLTAILNAEVEGYSRLISPNKNILATARLMF